MMLRFILLISFFLNIYSQNYFYDHLNNYAIPYMSNFDIFLVDKSINKSTKLRVMLISDLEKPTKDNVSVFLFDLPKVDIENTSAFKKYYEDYYENKSLVQSYKEYGTKRFLSLNSKSLNIYILKLKDSKIMSVVFNGGVKIFSKSQIEDFLTKIKL